MSLNYKTAQRLKEVGFPQSLKENISENFYFSSIDKKIYVACYGGAVLHEDAVKCPTLEELIEAFGGIELLYYTKNGKAGVKIRGEDEWYEAETLKEAVANLYIALHE